MIRLNTLKKVIIPALIALAVTLPLHKAAAEKGELAKLSQAKTINVMVGKAEMVTLPSSISDVMVANPSIIDVMPLKANQLYLVGLGLGDTNIMAMDDAGNIVQRINIHVQMDTEKLSEVIADLYPNEKVEVRALTDQLVLTGNVSTPAVSNSIANLVAQYAAEIQGSNAASIDEVVTNMLSVNGEQQVMLKVRIVEASRSALKDLGFETDLANARSGNFVGAAATATALGLSSPAQLGVLGLSFSTGNFGPLNFLARALEEEGILNTLAEPNLTAISGEQAGFLAGGEVPIPTQIDRNGNLIYEFRPFGVSLNFRPTVMSESRISLQMTTEVSTTTLDENLQLQGINIPSFNIRRAQTTVELPSGGTLMIAGLIQSDSISGLTEIPGVKEVPVVGDLMKSDTFQRNESEVVVIITPYLVKPFAQNNTAPMVDQSSKMADAKADLSSVPRLSLDDLSDLPPAEKQALKQDLGMAPPTGLSQRPILDQTPLPTEQAQSEQDKTALSRVFENNIRRTFGSQKVDQVLRENNGFGYMIE